MTDILHETISLPAAESENPSFSDRENEFSLLPTGEDFFADITGRIETAENSVGLQFYSFEADDEVRKVIEACRVAAERGVDIRILVDHLVSDPRHLAATRTMHREIRRIPNMDIRKIRINRGLGHVAVRDHKKIVTIDTVQDEPGGVAYIGGMNMTERSLLWNDFMVRMQGPLAQLIQQDFERTWQGDNRQAVEIEDLDNPGTRLLTDTGRQEKITQHVLGLIDGASERVWLETPYFHMASMGTALMRAKKRRPELDARVIIPRFSNYPIDRLRAGRICSTLSKAGIGAYQYSNQQGQLNHTKLLMVDNVAMFGSSNFNAGLLAGRNAEIVVATDNEPIVKELADLYEVDLAGSV